MYTFHHTTKTKKTAYSNTFISCNPPHTGPQSDRMILLVPPRIPPPFSIRKKRVCLIVSVQLSCLADNEIIHPPSSPTARERTQSDPDLASPSICVRALAKQTDRERPHYTGTRVCMFP